MKPIPYQSLSVEPPRNAASDAIIGTITLSVMALILAVGFAGPSVADLAAENPFWTEIISSVIALVALVNMGALIIRLIHRRRKRERLSGWLIFSSVFYGLMLLSTVGSLVFPNS